MPLFFMPSRNAGLFLCRLEGGRDLFSGKVGAACFLAKRRGISTCWRGAKEVAVNRLYK